MGSQDLVLKGPPIVPPGGRPQGRITDVTTYPMGGFSMNHTQTWIVRGGHGNPITPRLHGCPLGGRLSLDYFCLTQACKLCRTVGKANCAKHTKSELQIYQISPTSQSNQTRRSGKGFRTEHLYLQLKVVSRHMQRDSVNGHIGELL